MKMLLYFALVFQCIISAWAGTEYVTLVKVLENDDQGIIERSNGEQWLIEKGVGAISFWRYEGKKIVIHSPGSFCGVGAKLILPDAGQEAKIWEAELIDEGSVASPKLQSVSDAQLTMMALQILGYYAPNSPGTNDIISALKTFQKTANIKETGTLSPESQLALAQAVSSHKPITEESLRLASLLLQSSKTLSGSISSTTSQAPTKAKEAAVESQMDGQSEGWDGNTVIKLTNGQIWKQTEYYYYYRYAYMPKVFILNSGGGFKIIIDGIPKAVGVTRIK